MIIVYKYRTSAFKTMIWSFSGISNVVVRFTGDHVNYSCETHILHMVRPDDGRSISRNVASLNILVHDVIIFCIMNTEQTSKNIFTYIVHEDLYFFLNLCVPLPKLIE